MEAKKPITTADIINDINKRREPPPEPEPGPEPAGNSPRKNTGIVLFAGIIMRASGVHRCQSSGMATIIKELDLHNEWTRDPRAKDDHGVSKSLGDIMGGHGNLYEGSSGGYPRTFTLPDLTDINDHQAISQYVQSRGLNVLETMEQYQAALGAYIGKREPLPIRRNNNARPHKSYIGQHHSEDWCHLCGKRRKELADVAYPNNAEGDQPICYGPGYLQRGKYIRVCSVCANTVYEVAKGNIKENRPPNPMDEGVINLHD